MDVLLLRFDAVLMSFGGVVVDNRGVTRPFPGRAMLAGLLGNALGFTHAEVDRLEALQGRLRYAARCDRRGETLVDFQTVDLGASYMREGWTTRGVAESRGGASASSTHIRYRHFLADAIHTVALALLPAEGSPGIEELARALAEPARPLFLGRKSCLPSGPLLLGRVEAGSLREALEKVPRVAGRGAEGRLSAWWPAEEAREGEEGRVVAVTDDRDWANQIHVGRRMMFEGWVMPEEVSDGV